MTFFGRKIREYIAQKLSADDERTKKSIFRAIKKFPLFLRDTYVKTEN